MRILCALLLGVLIARGQELPSASAETLDGKKVDFPGALRGSISVVVFGFGRDSSNKTAIWLENLAGDGVNAWSLVNIESSAAPTRMVVRMTMRKGTPATLLGRSLVISKGSKAWKQLLEVSKESLPVVVLFDAEGHIAWKRQGTFSGAISDELKAQIAMLGTR
jgi:predicted transcriptional regulator